MGGYGRNIIFHGDCIDVMRSIDDASIDAVICDPPYAEINRDYGRLTEAGWHELMDSVVTHCKRVLKPSGSAVFVLQPNSEQLGKMRTWLWEFMAKWGKEWGIVQDVYWWNFTTIPNRHCDRKYGLMRPSVKYCVWLGAPDCYRNQDEILWDAAKTTKSVELMNRCERRYYPSGYGKNEATMNQSYIMRGGVTPFNLLPLSNGATGKSAGEFGHGAGTPYNLCDWWIRYITRPGELVLDPFMGAGTTALACIDNERDFIGIEKMYKYVAICNQRIEAKLKQT